MTANILIIDDDEILAGLLELTLELEGYRVSIAPDGDEGLARVRGERFDLILLDLVMPRIDGIKFLRLLNESGLHRPPVMIVSSATGTELTDQYRALGVVALARKPVEPAQLVQRVAQLLASEGSR